MNLGHGTLEDWLKKNANKKGIIRNGDNFQYASNYDTFKNYLLKNIHNDVTKGAILEEIKSGKNVDKMIWLNDHGPKHIETVIQRASELLNSKCNLNLKEVFLLLNAIQVHDIGNIFGRTEHEKNILSTVNKGLTPIVFDNTEVNYIRNIAQVHGGKIKYKDGQESKNTIAQIKPTVVSNGYEIRLHLLASILRFADELADDKTRADISLLSQGRLPKGSEIFHAYAFCLDSVRIQPQNKKIELHFKISSDFLKRKFGKYISDELVVEKFLIDEIFERVLKMHYERIYCSKFWKNEIDIEDIWVSIEFYNNVDSEEVISDRSLQEVCPDITFTLRDDAYPHTKEMTIHTICPNLTTGDGKKISGELIYENLMKNEP